MKNGGVIFDFNGTLFWDSEYVEISWDKYLASHHIYLSSLQKKEQIHGKTPKDIFNFFLRRDLSDSEVKQYTEDKELFIEMNV